MAGIKIVDLPAVGRDLAATDLFEMSLVGGTGSRKITGQEIMNASKLSVNNTPVINGTAGRIFFQDAANVLQQSGNLFWNNTTNRLGIGTATPTAPIHILYNPASQNGINIDATANNVNHIGFLREGALYGRFGINASSGEFRWDCGAGLGSYFATIYTGNAERLRIFTDGNLGLNTSTNAGFRLDVNGTARVSGNTLLDSGIIATSSGTTRLQSSLNFFSHQRLASSGAFGFDIRNSAATQCALWTYDAGSGNINFGGSTSAGALLLSTNNAERLRIFQTTGNIAINTTTDDGFRLDVNGTARVSGNTTIVGTSLSSFSVSNGATAMIQTASSGIGSSDFRFRLFNNGNTQTLDLYGSGDYDHQSKHAFRTNGTERMRIFSTGNVLINTTTDAGYKLDVNGTARVLGNLTITTGGTGTNTFNANINFLSANRNNVSGLLDLQNAANLSAFLAVTGTPTAGTGFDYFLIQGTTNSTTINTVRNIFNVSPTYNLTGTFTGIMRGFYYNPTLTSMTGVTAHYAIHSTSGRVRLEGLPTSPTGLSAGDLYNDGGTIKIV
jgi:hypothetical protein